MRGNVWGHIYDRQRCSWKLECVIPQFNYSKISRDGLFVIAFMHMPVKNAIPLKLLLESGVICSGTYDEQMCCEK